MIYRKKKLVQHQILLMTYKRAQLRQNIIMPKISKINLSKGSQMNFRVKIHHNSKKESIKNSVLETTRHSLDRRPTRKSHKFKARRISQS